MASTAEGSGSSVAVPAGARANGSASQSLAQLVAILQLAYSGERAAGYAYRGHWKSVSDPEERAAIRRIEDEEWHHRELVGELLAGLGARPSRMRELRTLVIGRTLGALCHAAGWFAPMYGAGRLESRNICEYEAAARHALDAGRVDLVECLLAMAEVEREHERYFRSKVVGHRLTRWIRVWPEPAESPGADARALATRDADS